MADRRKKVGRIRCDAFNDDPLRVARVATSIPPHSEIALCSARLSAASHPVRLTILFALEQEALCVCELSSLLETSAPAAMHHIQRLAGEGLIDVEKRGKFAEYFLTSTGQETVDWAHSLYEAKASA